MHSQRSQNLLLTFLECIDCVNAALVSKSIKHPHSGCIPKESNRSKSFAQLEIEIPACAGIKSIVDALPKKPKFAFDFLGVH